MSETTLKRLKNATAECTIIFAENEVKSAETKALAGLGKDITIKGFRPGNAPEAEVRKRVGDQALFEETVRLLLNESIPSLVKEHDLKPILPPKVTAVTREPLTLQIVFVEHPEVSVKNAEKLSIPKPTVEIDPKDKKRAIDSVLREHRVMTKVDRAATKSDQVIFDFTATTEDGKTIEGMQGQAYPTVLGDGEILPGMEEQLEGLKAGDEKTFVITLPPKFGDESLRGKPATFSVKVLDVFEVKPPELTDSFVKEKLGEDSVAAFEKNVEEALRRQEEQFQRFDRERQLLEEITKRTSVELAEPLIEEEMRALIHDWQERLQRTGATMEEWLKRENKTVKDLDKEFRTQAEDRLKLRFGVQELIKIKNIQLTPEEAKRAMEEHAEMHKDHHHDHSDHQGEVLWRATVDKLTNELLK